jgi:hypothetical protein
MQTEEKLLLLLLIATFCSVQILQLAHAEGFQREDAVGIVQFASEHEMIRKKYDLCQEAERWEKLTNPILPLRLIDWQLFINPGSSDKYMDKRIIGTVKNNSEKRFSEVKVEFTVYDEEGGQIAIVSNNVYDLKPGGIWKFEISVTSDVGKAEFNGLYVPLKEIKTRGGTKSERKKFPLFLRHYSHLWECKDA